MLNLLITLFATVEVFIAYLWASYKIQRSIDSIDDQLAVATRRIAALETVIQDAAVLENGEIFPRCNGCMTIAKR